MLKDRKFCPRCETEKPIDDFYKNSSRSDGRDVYCRRCASEYRNTTKAKNWPSRRNSWAEQTLRQIESFDNRFDDQ